MSDEETQPEGDQQEVASRYLTRSKMLPVEGVVYCLEHTAVHDNTTDPYGYGEPDCDAKEHRPVYYRGRKGDLDETRHDEEARFVGEQPPGEMTDTEAEPVKPRVIAAASGDGLTDEERGLVRWLVEQAGDNTADVADSLRRIFGDDDSEVLAEVDQRLTLLMSVHRKLGGGGGEQS